MPILFGLVLSLQGFSQNSRFAEGQIDSLNATLGQQLTTESLKRKKLEAGSDYQPTLLVTTRQQNGAIEIRVRDNGNGFPESIKEKIFQPFFTTKPTGQGTGLGLSLSYDIVKAHGGGLKVEMKEGEGSEFIISLPIVRIID
jgi:signal transduction histidine kinase